MEYIFTQFRTRLKKIWYGICLEWFGLIGCAFLIVIIVPTFIIGLIAHYKLIWVVIMSECVCFIGYCLSYNISHSDYNVTRKLADSSHYDDVFLNHLQWVIDKDTELFENQHQRLDSALNHLNTSITALSNTSYYRLLNPVLIKLNDAVNCIHLLAKYERVLSEMVKKHNHLDSIEKMYFQGFDDRTIEHLKLFVSDGCDAFQSIQTKTVSEQRRLYKKFFGVKPSKKDVKRWFSK